MSERQLYRLLNRYHEQGDAGLVHRLRGQPSNRAYDETDKIKVVRLYRERYHDYGPTLFSEVLADDQALTVALVWDRLPTHRAKKFRPISTPRSIG